MNDHRFSKAISRLTLLYFLILFAERAQSIVRVIANGSFFATGYDTYTDLLTTISLAATVVLIFTQNRDFLRSLIDGSVVPNYTKLSITAGVILAGGMVHTEYTIAPIQFASYGALIVALIVRTVENAPAAKSKPGLWYSLAYLTVYSMSIPVMYRSFIELAWLFHIIAAITALVLVCCFTMMMRRLLTGDGEDLLDAAPFLIMAILDAIVIGMRWNEEVNTFALIFAIATAVMFVIGKLVLRKK